MSRRSKKPNRQQCAAPKAPATPHVPGLRLDAVAGNRQPTPHVTPRGSARNAPSGRTSHRDAHQDVDENAVSGAGSAEASDAEFCVVDAAMVTEALQPCLASTSHEESAAGGPPRNLGRSPRVTHGANGGARSVVDGSMVASEVAVPPPPEAVAVEEAPDDDAGSISQPSTSRVQASEPCLCPGLEDLAVKKYDDKDGGPGGSNGPGIPSPVAGPAVDGFRGPQSDNEVPPLAQRTLDDVEPTDVTAADGGAAMGACANPTPPSVNVVDTINGVCPIPVPATLSCLADVSVPSSTGNGGASAAPAVTQVDNTEVRPAVASLNRTFTSSVPSESPVARSTPAGGKAQVVQDGGALGVMAAMATPKEPPRRNPIPKDQNTSSVVEAQKGKSSAVLFGLLSAPSAPMTTLWKALRQMDGPISKAVEKALADVVLGGEVSTPRLRFDPVVWGVPTTLPLPPHAPAGNPKKAEATFVALSIDGEATPQLYFTVACAELMKAKSALTGNLGGTEFVDVPALNLALEDVGHAAVVLTVAALDRHAATFASALCKKKALYNFGLIWPDLVSLDTPLMTGLLRDIVANGVKTCLSKTTVDPLDVSVAPVVEKKRGNAYGKGQSARAKLESPRCGSAGAVSFHFENPSWGAGKEKEANARFRERDVPHPFLSVCYTAALDTAMGLLEDIGTACAAAVAAPAGACPLAIQHTRQTLAVDPALVLCLASALRQPTFADLRDLPAPKAAHTAPGRFNRAFVLALVVLEQIQSALAEESAQFGGDTDPVPLFGPEAAALLDRARGIGGAVPSPNSAPPSAETLALGTDTAASLLKLSIKLCVAAGFTAPTLLQLTAMAFFLRTEACSVLADAKGNSVTTVAKVLASKNVAAPFIPSLEAHLEAALSSTLQSERVASASTAMTTALRDSAARTATDLRVMRTAMCRDILRTADTDSSTQPPSVPTMIKRCIADASLRCFQVLDRTFGTTLAATVDPDPERPLPSVLAACPEHRAAALTVLSSAVTAADAAVLPDDFDIVTAVSACGAAVGVVRLVCNSGAFDSELEASLDASAVVNSCQLLEERLARRLPELFDAHCGPAFGERFRSVTTAPDPASALAIECPFTAQVSDAGSQAEAVLLLDALFAAALVAGVAPTIVSCDVIGDAAAMAEQSLMARCRIAQPVDAELPAVSTIAGVVRSDTALFRRCVVALRALHTAASQGDPLLSAVTAVDASMQQLRDHMQEFSLDRALRALRAAWQALWDEPEIASAHSVATALSATEGAFRSGGYPDLADAVVSERDGMAQMLSEELTAAEERCDAGGTTEHLLRLAVLGEALDGPGEFKAIAERSQRIIGAAVAEMEAGKRSVPAPLAFPPSELFVDRQWAAAVARVIDRYVFLQTPEPMDPLPAVTAFRSLAAAAWGRVESLKAASDAIAAWIDDPSKAKLTHQSLFVTSPALLDVCLFEVAGLATALSGVAALTSDDVSFLVDATIDALHELHDFIDGGMGTAGADADDAALSALCDVVKRLSDAAVAPPAPAAKVRRTQRRTPAAAATDVTLARELVAEFSEISAALSALLVKEETRGAAVVSGAASSLSGRELRSDALVGAVADARRVLPQSREPLVLRSEAIIHEAVETVRQSISAPPAAADLRRTLALAAMVSEAHAVDGALPWLLGPKSRATPEWRAAATASEDALRGSLRGAVAPAAVQVGLKAASAAAVMLKAQFAVAEAACGAQRTHAVLVEFLETSSPLSRVTVDASGTPVPLTAARAAEVAAWAPPPALREILGQTWTGYVERAVRTLLAAVAGWETRRTAELSRDGVDTDPILEGFARDVHSLYDAAGRGLLLSDPGPCGPLRDRLSALAMPSATAASSVAIAHPSARGQCTEESFKRDHDMAAAIATLSARGGSHKVKDALANAVRAYADDQVDGVKTTPEQAHVLRTFVKAASTDGVAAFYSDARSKQTVARVTKALEMLDKQAVDAIRKDAEAVGGSLANLSLTGDTVAAVRRLSTAHASGSAPSAAAPLLQQSKADCAVYAASSTQVLRSLLSAVKDVAEDKVPNPVSFTAVAADLRHLSRDDCSMFEAFCGAPLPEVAAVREEITREAHIAFGQDAVRRLFGEKEAAKSVALINVSQRAVKLLSNVGAAAELPSPVTIFEREAREAATAAGRAWDAGQFGDLNRRLHDVEFAADVGKRVANVAPDLDRSIGDVNGNLFGRIVTAMKRGPPCKGPEEVAERLKQLASKSIKARRLEDCVQLAMDDVLQRAPGDTTQAVGAMLARDGCAEAQAVLTMLPKPFEKVHRKQWQARAGEQSLETVIGAFEYVSRDRASRGGLPEDRGAILKSGLKEANAAVKSAIDAADTIGFEYVTTMDAHKESIFTAAAVAKSHATRTNMKAFVAAVVASYTALRSPDHFKTFDPNGVFRPHHAQVLALLKLLDVDAIPESGAAGWFKSFVGAGQAVKARCQLAQIKTGEGKSITLAMLGAIFALLGFDVDIVCYSKDLTERDEQDAHEFLQWLDVTAAVKYETLASLCERRLSKVRDRVQAAIDGTPLPKASVGANAKETVLLIDEVDVFCSRRFYGRLYNPVAMLRRPQITALIREIFANRDRPQKFQQASLDAALAATPALLRDLLTSYVAAMTAGVKDFNFGHPHFDPATKRVGYKVADRIDYTTVYGDRTPFKYLSLVEAGQMTEEDAAPHLGVPVSAGVISYAEEPMGYNVIVGVTGTLRTSGTKKTDLLTPATYAMLERYKITTFSYIPSVFGEGKEVTFNPAHDVYILDKWADWLSEIERRCKALTQRGAVACFAKNKAMLEQLRPDRADGVRGWLNDITFVWEDTSQKERTSAINAVGNKGNVTAFTRAFARGTDFRMIDGVELAVLLLFLPSTLSEMAQAFGRTGRQGQPGRVEFILCKEHLVAKFGPCGYDHDDAMAEKNKGTIHQYFERLQRKRTDEKEAVREKAYHEARAKHDKSREAVAAICAKTCPGDIMRIAAEFTTAALGTRRRCAVAGQRQSYHLALDASGSMAGRPWTDLCQAYDAFLTALRDNGAGDSFVTVSTFDYSDHPISATTAAATAALPASNQWQGGTNFDAAFESLRGGVSRSPADATVGRTLLFLTDGEGSWSPGALNTLIALPNITTFYIFFFGRQATPQLTQIQGIVENRGIQCKLSAPTDGVALQKGFEEVAAPVALNTA